MDAILFNYSCTFHPDSNSAHETIVVSELWDDVEGRTEHRRLHELQRELLWEDGKAVSMAFDFNKALSRFAEACGRLVDPF